MKLIDFQLLVTHVIAFLLVLWLLRRYAWGPVLEFLERRRRGIEEQYESIEQQKKEVEALKRRYEDHLRNIDAEARRRIQEAVAEGNAAAARIKEKAQQERQMKLQRAEEEIKRLEEAAREAVRKRAVEMALLAAEKAIYERLEDSKHKQLIERFVEEMDRTGTGG